MKGERDTMKKTMLNSVASTPREERNTQMKTTAKRMRQSVLGMLTLAPLALALAGCGEAMSEEQMLLAAQEGDKAGAEVGQARQEALTTIPLSISTTQDVWTFLMDKNNNIIAVKERNTASGVVEVSVLTAASNYQQYAPGLKDRPVPLAPLTVDAQWDVEADPDGNLYFILKWGGASKKTEVHALLAAAGYQQFFVHADTALPFTDATWDFEVDAYQQLFCIRKQGGSSNRTELSVLAPGADKKYRTFSVPTRATKLHTTGNDFNFAVNYLNGDVWAIKQGVTGSGTTELHVLGAAYGWLEFTEHQPTDHPFNNKTDWAFKSDGSLAGIYKQHAGSARTELRMYRKPVGGGFVIPNGSFESGPPLQDQDLYLELSANDRSIPGWVVGGEGIDYKATSYWQPADGRRSIDLNRQAEGSIQTTALTTVPGTTYTIFFDMAGNVHGEPGLKTMHVTAIPSQAPNNSQANYSFDTTGKSSSNMGWTSKSYTFTATTNQTVLKFTSTTVGKHGPAIDRVR
jgi:choice-of-anchor C domain-containing protein